MKTVIQRVAKASVTVNGEKISAIDNGLLILVGIENADAQDDIDWLTNKIVNLRIFNDEDGIMNKSLVDVNGDVIVVSQFTLHASTKKGNRPSYIKAARPEQAMPLYQQFITALSIAIDKNIKSGEFGANMKIMLTNDGPVTIIIDTKNKE